MLSVSLNISYISRKTFPTDLYLLSLLTLNFLSSVSLSLCNLFDDDSQNVQNVHELTPTKLVTMLSHAAMCTTASRSEVEMI